MNRLLLIWAWTAVAAVGCAYTALNLRSAVRDRRAQEATGLDGVLRIVTLANIRRETVRLTFWVLAIVVGVAAHWEAAGDAAGWVLILVMLLNAYNSREDRRERLAVGQAERP